MKITRLNHLDEFSRADSHFNTVLGNHGTIAKEDNLTQNWAFHYFVVSCQGLKESNSQKSVVYPFLLPLE